MNSIEDRLRDAFRADAETIAPETIRPGAARPGSSRARVRSVRSGRGRTGSRPGYPGSRFRPRRLVISLSAAVAVAAIAVVTVMAASSVTPGGNGSSPTGGGAFPAPGRNIAQGFPGARPPAVPAPRFFAGILPTRTNTAVTQVAVYSSATGRIVGRFGAPVHGQQIRAVAALGGRTFVVAATRGSPRAHDCRTELSERTISAQGKPTGASGDSGWDFSGWATALATDGNGKLVDAAVRACGTGSHEFAGPAHLAVINLAAGKVQMEPASLRVGSNLSLSASGRFLSFTQAVVYEPARQAGAAGSSGVQSQAGWVALPGSPAIPAREVLTAPGGVLATVLSPTGRVMYALTSQHGGGPPFRELLGAYDTATGQLIRALHSWPRPSEDRAPAMTADSSGRYLLEAGKTSGVQIVDVVTGQVRTVPVSPAHEPLAVAW